MPPVTGRPWGKQERELHLLATELLRARYRAHRHTVAAALRTGSGKVYTGVCVDGLHSPCAETIAVGAALSEGEREVIEIVAVGRAGVLSPCGNCRQMLVDYAPRARVLVRAGRRRLSVLAEDLLPYAMHTFGKD